MYGIINKAIQELICLNYGEDKWEQIKKTSGIGIDFFLSNEPYDDSVTYKLAQAAADELQISLSDVLLAFGEFWVLHTGMKNYGGMMKAGGPDLRSFLVNLPNFHNRVSLIYPKLTPPEFKVDELGNGSLRLHYYSSRRGLEDFVIGLLTGLSKLFKEPVSIVLECSRNSGHDHEEYLITWI